MITLSTTTAVLIGAVLALWLIGATWAVVTGLKMRAQAREAVIESVRLRRLIETAPALPLVVRPDGRVDASERLAAWLGLPRLPNFIVDFAGVESGLTGADAETLARDITAAQKSAKSFSRAVTPQGGARTLRIVGAPAAPGTNASVVLWLFDATESEAELGRLRTEAARLAKAFEALAQLIEAAPIPMWHRGPDLRLTLVNRAYVEAVDAANAEDAVARGLELVEAAGGMGPIAAASAARDSREVRARVVPATIGGQRRSVRIVDVPLGDAGVAGYAIDNDELERARGDFRRFASAQRDMLDRLSAGVAQFDNDRCLAFSNLPFLRLFGLKPEWVADRPEFDRILERMREAGRTPEVRDFPAWKTERRAWFNRLGDATEEAWLLPGGAHLRVLGQPLPDGGLLLVFEDRTEEIQLASARDTLLRVREATFDNLFEAVGVFAADGRLNVWNNRFQKLWGFEEALLASHPRVDALAQAAAPMLATPSRASVIGELVRAATVDRKSRSGRVAFKDGRHFEFGAVPLPDGNALLTMLDITDSRRIERALRDRTEALEAADKVKTAFVANMSYELRTPLTSIGGFAEMLAGGYAGKLNKPAKDYVQAILDSVATLGTLVDDVLRMTQSDAGLGPVDRETVDLVTLLEGVAAHYDAAAAAKQQVLVRDFAGDLGRVAADPKALRDAVGALLEQAIASTAEGGRLLLHASMHETGVQFVVSDDGAGEGVDPAAARALIEAMGASMTVMAEAGVGTMVQIVMPRG